MKPLALLFTTVIFIPFLSFSQGLIGKNEKEVVSRVKSGLAGKISEVTRSYTNDGTLSVGWDNYETKSFHVVFFNKSGKAVIEATQPENISTFNSYVEFYDKMCVKISSTQWKWYLAGKTYKIELFYNEKSNKYSFYLSLWD